MRRSHPPSSRVADPRRCRAGSAPRLLSRPAAAPRPTTSTGGGRRPPAALGQHRAGRPTSMSAGSDPAPRVRRPDRPRRADRAPGGRPRRAVPVLVGHPRSAVRDAPGVRLRPGRPRASEPARTTARTDAPTSWSTSTPCSPRPNVNGPFVLVGHSFAAWPVALYAATYPTEVARCRARRSARSAGQRGVARRPAGGGRGEPEASRPRTATSSRPSSATRRSTTSTWTWPPVGRGHRRPRQATVRCSASRRCVVLRASDTPDGWADLPADLAATFDDALVRRPAGVRRRVRVRVARDRRRQRP